MRFREVQHRHNGQWSTGAILYELDDSVFCYYWPAGRVNVLGFGVRRLESVAMSDVANKLPIYAEEPSRFLDIREAPDGTPPFKLPLQEPAAKR